MKRLAIPTVLVFLLISAPAMASSSDDTLPNGTPIDVTVNAPLDGTEYVVSTPSGTVDVDVEGTASVGFGNADATIVYVVDVSGSATDLTASDCGGDQNADGLVNSILDCEIAGVLALNDAAIASGSVDEVGVAAYGKRAVVADMTPLGGDDPITTPGAGPGDVTAVVKSIIAQGGLLGRAGPGLFTPKDADEAGTNFAAGLVAAKQIVDASSNSTNIVVFLSDGESNSGSSFDTDLDALAATGAIAHTFAIGASSTCTGGMAGTLQHIAFKTGGICTEVTNPADLAAVISAFLASTLESLQLSVDGGPATAIPATASTPALPHDGPISVNYTTPANDLGVGAHSLCVTAFGYDAGGVGDSGPACTNVSVFAIELNPPHADRELGVDASHTVTATILGEASSVDGRMVTFTVVSGPNAGASGSCTASVDCATDTGGHVSWTYASNGVSGTDTIRACFTVATPTGQTGCDTATVEWADNTPPLAACLPGPNPHGKKIPPAGTSSLPGAKGGQNEDGFYDLMAEDLVDPNPLVYVMDDATGHRFGPYPAGTIVKWTQAPGAQPSEKKMGSTKGQAGAVDYHLKGQGDMLIYAVDIAGNASNPLVCLVPPLPK